MAPTESYQGIETIKVRVLPDRRVTRRDAAAMLGRSVKTMMHWKTKGWGPRPIVVGGRVFHDYDECLRIARGEKPVVPIAAA